MIDLIELVMGLCLAIAVPVAYLAWPQISQSLRLPRAFEAKAPEPPAPPEPQRGPVMPDLDEEFPMDDAA